MRSTSAITRSVCGEGRVTGGSRTASAQDYDPPTCMRIGKNVKAMEQRVAALFGKRLGVMCNSGSSALYLAIEVLGLEPGDEIITSSVTFSTDIAPMVRAGLVPTFVDVTPDTFQIDV